MSSETSEVPAGENNIERWFNKASVFEEDLAMGTGRTLPEIQVSQEATEQAERVLEKLRKLGDTGEAVTLSIYGDTDFTSEDSRTSLFQFRKLRDRLTRLPPLTNDRPLPREVVIALGRKLQVFPRRTSDFYVYKSPYPQDTWPGEMDYYSAIHNVLPLRQLNLPRHTYWHEIDAGLSTVSLVSGIVISVNKDLGDMVTTSLIAQAKNKLYTKALFHLE